MPLPLDVWIRDPVHGSVKLTRLEEAIIDTPAFQRLRRVKQLGLASMAFPSADYSRFEHSLGVAHVTGRLLEQVRHRRSSSDPLTDESIQLYRLAALLHDVGHYPFSHTLEHAIEEHFRGRAVVSDGVGSEVAAPQRPLNHVAVGKLILAHDPDISEILHQAKIDADLIGRIFNREAPQYPFACLINSDLDADRLDYLARTASHTGIPQSATDVEYLIERVRLDNDGRVCFDSRALRSVEHVMIARYFDYQTIVRHRVVCGLETLLQEVLPAVLSEIKLDLSERGLIDMVKSQRWVSFDDLYLMTKIRNLPRDDGRSLDPETTMKIECVLRRRPPALVAEAEGFVNIAESGRPSPNWGTEVRQRLSGWCNELGIPSSALSVWHPRSDLQFAKGPPTAATPASDRESDEPAEEVRARIYDKSTGTSAPVVDVPHSILHVLGGYQLRHLRLYWTAPEHKRRTAESIRDLLAPLLKRDLPDLPWKYVELHEHSGES